MIPEAKMYSFLTSMIVVALERGADPDELLSVVEGAVDGWKDRKVAG